jgi:DnaJ family protein A protein 2
MAGDVYVRILIEKHKVFVRAGADLFIEKKITLLEALTGTNFTVKHLDGSSLKVLIILFNVI